VRNEYRNILDGQMQQQKQASAMAIAGSNSLQNLRASSVSREGNHRGSPMGPNYGDFYNAGGKKEDL
jgi:hypothetical protein